MISNPNLNQNKVTQILELFGQSNLLQYFVKYVWMRCFGNRPNTHFTKIGWRNIEAAFKNKTDKS
jgi:hypothetical protein